MVELFWSPRKNISKSCLKRLNDRYTWQERKWGRGLSCRNDKPNANKAQTTTTTTHKSTLLVKWKRLMSWKVHLTFAFCTIQEKITMDIWLHMDTWGQMTRGKVFCANVIEDFDLYGLIFQLKWCSTSQALLRLQQRRLMVTLVFGYVRIFWPVDLIHSKMLLLLSLHTTNS